MEYFGHARQLRDVAKQRFGFLWAAFSFWCVLTFCSAFCSVRFVGAVGLAFALLHFVATGLLRFEMTNKTQNVLQQALHPKRSKTQNAIFFPSLAPRALACYSLIMHQLKDSLS